MSAPPGHFARSCIVRQTHPAGTAGAAVGLLTGVVYRQGVGFSDPGIPWSRLALGAHHLTDVLDDFLFGLGWALVELALQNSRCTT
jgi:hypothetical protein